jgi:hypothetical protein
MVILNFMQSNNEFYTVIQKFLQAETEIYAELYLRLHSVILKFI